MSKALERLASAFQRPFGAKADAMVVEYHRAIGDRLESDELEGAIDAAIRDGERWPLPAKLKALAADYRATHRRAGFSPSGPAPDICPACRREWFYAGFEMPSGDVLPRWRCGCPPASERWFTPKAKAWRETHPSATGGAA
jgi:hypothetical protein